MGWGGVPGWAGVVEQCAFTSSHLFFGQPWPHPAACFPHLPLSHHPCHPPPSLLPPSCLQGYDIYRYTAGIPGRDADPQPIIFAYISLNLQTLSQSGMIAPPGAAGTAGVAGSRPASAEGSYAAAGGPAEQQQQDGAAAELAAQQAQQVVQQAMSDQQKAEVKGRLKDVMSRLMQRDQSGAAMRELYALRK